MKVVRKWLEDDAKGFGDKSCMYKYVEQEGPWTIRRRQYVVRKLHNYTMYHPMFILRTSTLTPSDKQKGQSRTRLRWPCNMSQSNIDGEVYISMPSWHRLGMLDLVNACVTCHSFTSTALTRFESRSSPNKLIARFILAKAISGTATDSHDVKHRRNKNRNVLVY